MSDINPGLAKREPLLFQTFTDTDSAMSLIRLITFVLLLWMVWVMIKSFLNKQRWRADARRGEDRSLEAGKIVKCRHCEVHLPEREAFARDDDWFCSREHMQAFLHGGDKR